MKLLQQRRTDMNSTAWQKTIGALGAIGALAVGGCNKGSETTTVTTTTTVTKPAPTPTEAPARSNTGAAVKPPAGFGNAQGRVLFDEKPAAGIVVQLCEKISFISGCSGKTYTAKTDADGNYTIDKVPPGGYSLAVRIFNTDGFVYPTDGLISATKYEITAGETLDIRATNLFKTDLQTVSPKAGEVIKTGAPKLTWKAYPSAATYEISLGSMGSGGETQSLTTASTSIAPETPLLNGSYSWTVTARNANGIKLAETRTRSPFKVEGQSGSSKVTLTAPRPDAAIPGNGLTFTWQKHPLANGYQIYLNAATGTEPILSFEKVEATSYPLAKNLAPGQYFWSVTATRDGKKVAASELQSFRVK